LTREQIETIANQSIFRRDLQEINKIELLEEAEPSVKSRILGQVPLFLIKVSKSYYQKVEQYTRQFMNRGETQVLTTTHGNNLMNSGNTKRGTKLSYMGARARKKM
jgi:hypothetical protein